MWRERDRCICHPGILASNMRTRLKTGTLRFLPNKSMKHEPESGLTANAGWWNGLSPQKSGEDASPPAVRTYISRGERSSVAFG